MKKKSFLLILGLVVAVLVAGSAVSNYVKTNSLKRDLVKVEQLLANLKEEDLREKNSGVVNAVKAVKTIDFLEEEGLRWSTVLKDIRSALPKESRDPIVEVLSYSGNSSSSLSLSVKTLDGREDPYFDVAEVIKSFDESENFTGVFVPSISGSENENGEEILSFNVELNYLEVIEEEVVSPLDSAPIGR